MGRLFHLDGTLLLSTPEGEDFILVRVKRHWVPDRLWSWLGSVPKNQPFRWLLTKPAGTEMEDVASLYVLPIGLWERGDFRGDFGKEN
jgi:hypothetical protein